MLKTCNKQGLKRHYLGTNHKLGMTGHKDFFESGVKTKEGTLSKGVAEKDTRTRFGVEFVGRVGKT